MKPTIKHNGNNTYHQDGTVSYWDVRRQQWVRQSALHIHTDVLATMTDYERRRIARHAVTTN